MKKYVCVTDWRGINEVFDYKEAGSHRYEIDFSKEELRRIRHAFNCFENCQRLIDAKIEELKSRNEASQEIKNPGLGQK